MKTPTRRKHIALRNAQKRKYLRHDELGARIDQLEEIVDGEKKSKLDSLKEWGGVATLIVALLYTFPLGVWDRFILSAEARRASEVSALKKLVVELADVTATTASNVSQISDAETRNVYIRAMSTKQVTLLSRNRERVRNYVNELEAEEIVILAYTFGQTSQVRYADELYNMAASKAELQANPSLVSDVYRLKGALAYSDPTGVAIGRVRENYALAVASLQSFDSDPFRHQSANSIAEWALFEMTSGDWLCGTQLRERAFNLLSSVAVPNIQTKTMYETFYMNFAPLAKNVDQTAEGCPTEYESLIE